MSVPAAPTDVTVAPGTTSATVYWTASTSEDVTGYRIFCVPDNKRPNLASTSATSLLVQGLKNGISYSFRVYAINANGMSSTSAPTVPGTVPAAPKVTAIRNPSVPSSAILTWTAAPPKGSSLLYYNITTTPPAPDATIATNIVGNTTTITGLTNGTSYVFGVNATGLTGTSSNGSSKAVVTGNVPATPTVTGIHGLASVQLNWSAPSTNGLPITAYRVSYRPTSSTGAWTIVNTKVVLTLMLKGLVNGTSYDFKLQAINIHGISSESEIISKTPSTSL